MYLNRIETGGSRAFWASGVIAIILHLAIAHQKEHYVGESVRAADDFADAASPNAHRMNRPILSQLKFCGKDYNVQLEMTKILLKLLDLDHDGIEESIVPAAMSNEFPPNQPTKNIYYRYTDMIYFESLFIMQLKKTLFLREKTCILLYSEISKLYIFRQDSAISNRPLHQVILSSIYYI